MDRFATLKFAPGPNLSNDRKHVIQPLVVDDLRSMHRPASVERPVGQGKALMHDLQPAIRVITDDDLLPGQWPRDLRRIKNEQHLVVA